MNHRRDDMESILEDNPHIAVFIKKVKEEHGKYVLDHHFYRQSVVYICRMFNGLQTHHIRALIQGQIKGVGVDVQTALELRQIEHPKFMEIYNSLLQLYIDSTREFLENRHNGVHLMLSEHQRFHKN